jgi:SET domain-containing protein
MAYTKRKPRKLTEEDFEVKKSSIPGIGKGLFTRVDIFKGDTIGYYEGKILTDEQAERPRYANSAYLLYVCKDHYILGEGKQSNYTRYVNHSNKPNIEMINSTRWKTSRFQALKRIKAGEELFLHYGPDYADMLTREPN